MFRSVVGTLPKSDFANESNENHEGPTRCDLGTPITSSG
jgi:hypothetical protein